LNGSFIHTAPSSRPTLKQYREASRSHDGFAGVELFEQAGRPGHFAIVETWRDQKAFDGRDPAVQKRLSEALQPIRVSGYDQRPYKTRRLPSFQAAHVQTGAQFTSSPTSM
jgi:quinol monooxygenase YgiN